MKVKIPDFGLKGWPEDMPLIQRHQRCAYENRGFGAFYHKKEIISALWPDSFEWHYWNERRLRSICESNWNTWVGPGGSGKTTDAAVFALQYWLEAPHCTAVIVCSTTMKMLRKRIWAQVASYHQKLPNGLGPVGELLDSDTLIRWRKGDTKNGIFGMAVEEGPVEEVMNNLIGIHTHRVFLILDEMQGVREAILKATRNMGKNPIFKFLGMGNPESILDPLGRTSEPVNGWDSVERAVTETWEIHPGPARGNGRCDFFDGRKSPACLDADFARRNPWMINREQIDADLRAARGNENDPAYQSQTIGWWPAMGVDSTVLDEAILTKFKCSEKAVWTNGFQKVASLDPSFEGGDKKILRFLKFGEVEDEQGRLRWVIEFGRRVEVPIDANSGNPIHYQIVEFVKTECQREGIGPADFGLDSTGEGGGLAAIFNKEWGAVIEVEFGGKPSDRPLDESRTKLCSEEYDNRSTELNMAVRNFALANGIRGLTDQAATQFCARKTFYRNKKYRVEPKTTKKGGAEKGFKERLGISPDDADACAIGVEIAIQKGAIPASGIVKVDESPVTNAYLQEIQSEYDESNYTIAQN